MRRRLILSFLLGTTWFLVASSPAAPASGLDVRTTAGTVHGLVVGAEKEWRGVPYAAPPVGALRWRPPARVQTWLSVRDATAFAPECIQLGPDGIDGSEDCLYLNVFAPAGSTAASHLAVMVHLHPGSNTFGDAYHDAAAFTARNVIVVTVGYRLGVFGFVGHPALDARGGGPSGEYGVLDQIAALRWVHDNIATFGGDPRRVTLFGSSAGSFDAVAIAASPLSAGLITRVAVQGEYENFFNGLHNTIADAAQVGVEVLDGLGCNSAPDVAACLPRASGRRPRRGARVRRLRPVGRRPRPAEIAAAAVRLARHPAARRHRPRGKRLLDARREREPADGLHPGPVGRGHECAARPARRRTRAGALPAQGLRLSALVVDHDGDRPVARLSGAADGDRGLAGSAGLALPLHAQDGSGSLLRRAPSEPHPRGAVPVGK
jgi:hypothetical protein